MILYHNNKGIKSSFNAMSILKPDIKTMTYGEMLHTVTSDSFKQIIMSEAQRMIDFTKDADFCNNLMRIYIRYYQAKLKQYERYSKSNTSKKIPVLSVFRMSYDREFQDKIEQLMGDKRTIVYDSQLTCLFINTPSYQSQLMMGSFEEGRALEAKKVCSIMQTYVKNDRVTRGFIKTRYLKEFIMVAPNFREFEHPIYEHYIESLNNSRIIDTDPNTSLARGHATVYDSAYTSYGEKLDVQHLFKTKFSLLNDLGRIMTDITPTLFHYIMFYKLYGCYSEKVEFKGKEIPLISIHIAKELKISATAADSIRVSLDRITI